MIDCLPRSSLDAHRTYCGEIKRLERFRERLAAVLFLVLMIAIRERNGVLRADQRPAPFDVGQ